MGIVIFLVAVILSGVLTYYAFREKPAANKHNKGGYVIMHDPVKVGGKDLGISIPEYKRINPNLPTMKNPPPPPPRPAYKEPVSRDGLSGGRGPRELNSNRSDVADDLLLNPLLSPYSPISLWQSGGDDYSSSSSSNSDYSSSSSYDSESSSDSGGGDCGGD
jgi:hypothetical protein